jgi:hypothetical protein
MAMFLGHTAFMLELAVFVVGLALWHFGRQGAASALRAGGLIAMIGATLSALCTSYYLVRYQVQGDLDHCAFPLFVRIDFTRFLRTPVCSHNSSAWSRSLAPRVSTVKTANSRQASNTRRARGL